MRACGAADDALYFVWLWWRQNRHRQGRVLGGAVHEVRTTAAPCAVATAGRRRCSCLVFRLRLHMSSSHIVHANPCGGVVMARRACLLAVMRAVGWLELLRVWLFGCLALLWLPVVRPVDLFC